MDKENNYNYESLLLLDSYYSELKYYNNILKLLKKHKPFFFEINRLKKYKKEIIEIENKIKICENKIAKIIDK